MGFRPKTRREALLYELCASYGYCNDLGASALTNIDSANEIVQAILVAEDLDPVTCDRKTEAQLLQVVNDWLFDPHGRGAKSGLPN
jgi:hypothetical protein